MPATTNPKKRESIVDLINLTDKENPNPQDLQRIRERLDENASLVELNEVSERAFTSVVKSYSSSALVKELFERQIEMKRKAFEYESQSIMVQMLINQVILCHIRLNTFENWHAEKVKENCSIQQGLYIDKLLSGYQKRFQKACESLARVKKLLSEAELRDQQAKNKRSQSTLASANLYKKLS